VNKLNEEIEYVKDGIWFRDRYGRYVLFRGINFASRSKIPPYIPISSLNSHTINLTNLKKEINTVKQNLDYINELGFNVVRLPIIWKAIEPYPNNDLNKISDEGEQYLSLVAEIMLELCKRNLSIILDFHQDIAHELYGGDGFPDWALAIDKFHPRPLFPNIKDRGWASRYQLDHLVRHTLRSFWSNSLKNVEIGFDNYPVRTHLEKIIGLSLKYFKSLDNDLLFSSILGVEPFNEPHPVGFSKKDFEINNLQNFYLNVDKEIRNVDDKIFLFFQPRVDWNIYSYEEGYESTENWKNLSPFDIDLKINFVRQSSDIKTFITDSIQLQNVTRENGVFAFHYYDPWTMFYSFFNKADNMHNKQREWPQFFKEMISSASRVNIIPFLTEFGGNQDWESFPSDLEPHSTYKGKQIRAYTDLLFAQIESFLLNSTYWNYDLYNTEDGKDNWNLENFSLLGPNRNPRNIDIVARPYPMKSSAMPKKLFFDLPSKFAVIILEGNVIEVPTVIYVPFNVHYHPHFYVWATSTKFEWDRTTQILLWYPDKEKTINQIILGPSDFLRKDILPKESSKLLDITKFIGIF
jgi:hypothetical protein